MVGEDDPDRLKNAGLELVICHGSQELGFRSARQIAQQLLSERESLLGEVILGKV
jgi:hypothetical protein